MNNRNVTKVIFHCSASDDSLDIGFKEINGWHKKQGWVSPSGISCGYHYVVRRDGTVEKGRPENEVGSHVKGHNSNSIGIVWVGMKAPTEVQYAALLRTLRDVIDRHAIPIDRVYGHRELSPDRNGDGTIDASEWVKTCPNLDCNRVRADLLFTKGVA